MLAVWDPWLMAVGVLAALVVGIAPWLGLPAGSSADSDATAIGREDRGGSAQRERRWRRALSLAAGLLLIALLRPQWGTEQRTTLATAGSVWLCLDVSRSMLVRDVADNRLERGKALLAELLDAMAGRPIGVIAFAGEARMICPPTWSLDHVRGALGALSIDSAPPGGSNLAAPFRLLAGRAVKPRAATDLCVMVSDGCGETADAMDAVKLAKKLDLLVAAVGIGNPEHASAIPVLPNGSVLVERGEVVRSRLNEAPLTALASGTGGIYVPARCRPVDVAPIAHLAVERAGTIDRQRFLTAPAEQYRWFLVAALVLLVLETGRYRRVIFPDRSAVHRREAGDGAGALS